jgi:hypothetical protein
MNALSQRNPIVHYAKVDRWIAVLLGAVILSEFVAGTANLAAGLMSSNPAETGYFVISLIFFGTGTFLSLMLWACYHIRYEVTASDLIVRFGPFRSTLPLDTIIEVSPTRNPLSAPAPSLDRLQIDYRKKNGWAWFTLISPKDKEGFVRDLANAAPRLRGVGNDLLRLKAEAPA